MIDVDVDDDWTRTVTRIPIMTPTIGFERSSEEEKNEERFLPPRIRKEVLKNVSETTKRYRDTRMPSVFNVARMIRLKIVGCWNFMMT